MIKLLTFLTLFSAFAIGIAAQEPEVQTRPGVEIYLARDDGSGKAGPATNAFSVTDVPIYCVVELGSSDPATVKMNLVAVSVPGVKAETRVVSTVYTTKDKQDRVNFTGRPSGNWVAGKYRVDVFVNDDPVGSRDFTVQRRVPAATNQPAEGLTEPKFLTKPRAAPRNRGT